MGNIIHTLKRFSSNDATAIPTQGCSDLSIGTSRLDKCTYIGNGISVTGETTSASKRCSINGQKDFCEEVANEGMHMAPRKTSTKRCLHAIDLLSLPMVHTRPSGSDEENKEREASKGTVHTDVRELGSVDHSEKSCLIYSQTAGHMFHSWEDESTETHRSLMLDISKDSLCKASAEGNSFSNPKLEDDVESSPAREHRGKELILYGVSPADGLFGHNVCKELADGAHSCYESSAEVSLDGQRHEQRAQHKTLNYDVVPIEVITVSNLDVSNPKSSLKGRAKQKRTPLKGRAKRKRATKASSQMLVPKENTAISIPSGLICLETEKQPTSPLVQGCSGDKVLQGTPRSRMTATPVSYVHQSPHTHSRSKAPSICTPESVQMKRSRSGRLIVPRLDPGSQSIKYDPDGSICGITNLEVQCPKGISSEPPSKRSRHLSADHKRLLTF